MKKISLAFIAFSAIVTLTGCLKDKPNTDFSGIGPVLEISNASNNSVAQAPSSGYAYFPAATLFLTGLTEPDTITFTVNLASAYPLTKDINYTLVVDQAALAALNANTTTNSKLIQYSLFGSNQAVLNRTSGVIKAGTRLDTLQVVFYPANIDPTKSFAFPISIATADGGVTISGNLGTIYFHQIGNPIAGVYTWDFDRYPNSTGTGSPDGASFTGDETAFVPDDATTVEMPSGYFGGGERYVLTFTNTAGVLSDFAVNLNDDDVAYLKDNGITVTQPAKIITADPATKTYKFQYVVFNGSAYRWNVDTYHIP